MALTAALFIVSLAYYERLPARIPSHWNIHGQIDGYLPKWPGAFLTLFIMAGFCAGFGLLRWLSPRNYDVDRFKETFSYVMFCVVALVGYLHILILASALGGMDVSRWIIGGLFVFFAMIGNVMGRVRRNFWMGVRTPWTLASDRVWDETHRATAKLWVACGVIGALLTALGMGLVWLTVFFLVIAILPVPYSLYLSKRADA